MSAIPAVVGLCPVHGGEFWVPHEGMCPQHGCHEQLVIFVARARWPDMRAVTVAARDLKDGDHLASHNHAGRVELAYVYGVQQKDRSLQVLNPEMGQFEYHTQICGMRAGQCGFSLDPDAEIIVYRPTQDMPS